MLTNKKKIRGWKRKIKQIEQWKKRHIELDIEDLCRTHRDYVKLFSDDRYKDSSLLAQFSWELHIDAEQYALSELEDDVQTGFRTQKQMQRLIRNTYHEDNIQIGGSIDTLFSVRVGDVWVGALNK